MTKIRKNIKINRVNRVNRVNIVNRVNRAKTMNKVNRAKRVKEEMIMRVIMIIKMETKMSLKKQENYLKIKKL